MSYVRRVMMGSNPAIHVGLYHPHRETRLIMWVKKSTRYRGMKARYVVSESVCFARRHRGRAAAGARARARENILSRADKGGVNPDGKRATKGCNRRV